MDILKRSRLDKLVGMCSHDVRTQVLTCIQNWAFVFKDKPEYSAIQDAYEELKNKGYTFPEFSENDAMFSVVCAPNWKEESSCHRCKVAFTTFRRRRFSIHQVKSTAINDSA
ncbi:hypothetical protein X801_09262 [Opisthorchis viverrini]|uniref:VHS domain-containing protein n=1 Tax=Opisthorchis viverrini TaxID=6198 RepID=A0A1S8WKJ3_OPIVI|nr:hypothetical protein X801_09262 [Opisthorchis viverrini]